MEKEYWLSRWQLNNIKFHQSKVNACLMKYFHLLNIKPHQKILVPLCGKSSDMLWLIKQGTHVIGVELSEKACHDFFYEHDLSYTETTEGRFKKYTSENIEIFCGDFFSITPDMLGDISAVYDRAALIALPSEMRQLYAAKLMELTTHGSNILLISLLTSTETLTPPFSISEAEIQALYLNCFDILLLEKFLEPIAHLIERDYKEIHTVVYLLSR
jgi:thiopurine S-methyltransferase